MEGPPPSVRLLRVDGDDGLVHSLTDSMDGFARGGRDGGTEGA